MMDDVASRLRAHRKILFARDSACLQPLIDAICRCDHKTIVLWALECCEDSLQRLKQLAPGELRPAKAVEISRLWAEGAVKMPLAQRAILDAHAAAKDMASPEAEALCHAVGQGCGAVHTEAHAIGLPMYELTAIVRRFGEDYEAEVNSRIAEYLAALERCEVAAQDPALRWAEFLTREGVPNKEQLRREKLKRKSSAP
jgi:hypothetical protein